MTIKVPKRVLNLRLPPELHDRLLRAAAAHTWAPTRLIEDAVRIYLETAPVARPKPDKVSTGAKCGRCGCVGGAPRAFPRCECAVCHG